MTPKIPTHLLLAAVVTAGILAPQTARADAFIEAVAGVAQPFGDANYQDMARATPKLGVRVGVPDLWRYGRTELQMEAGMDWSQPRSRLDEQTNVDASFNRLRASTGPRLAIRVRPRLEVFARFVMGIDYLRGEAHGNVGGITLDGAESDVGFAMEPGAGVMAKLARWSVGGQFAIPFAFHGDDGDGLFDYNGYDIDFMFTLATSL